MGTMPRDTTATQHCNTNHVTTVISSQTKGDAVVNFISYSLTISVLHKLIHSLKLNNKPFKSVTDELARALI